MIDSYVDALCTEIKLSSQIYKSNIETVYIGGGTPSILSCDRISKIIETLNNAYGIKDVHEKRRGLFLQKIIKPAVEFSIEVNPGTIDRKKLESYKKLGVNRLSIGLQSTDDRDLKMLGRIHNYDQFVQTFEAAREAGFRNINVDLMQAIPGQDLNAWKKVLAVLGTWSPEHISAYSLIIEEGTEFEQMLKEGKLPLPDEEEERAIYYYTKEFLEKTGYHRYEISNYSKPGFECAHNLGYWTRKEYLGLGLNASSMVENTHWKNTADLNKYIKAFTSDLSEDVFEKITEDKEKLSHREQMEEFIMLGLRLTKGISKLEFIDRFKQDFDFTYGEIVSKMQSIGMIEDEDNRVRLTEKGLDVSNTVIAQFLQ